MVGFDLKTIYNGPLWGDQWGSCLPPFLFIELCHRISRYFNLFYSNEQWANSCSLEYNGVESKAEFYIVEGEIVEIKIKIVKGCRPLTGSKLKDFEVFLEKYSDNIVEKWIDYFVYHKNVQFEKINTRIKWK